MDFYVIPPNSQLNLMSEGKRYFCLAQHYYNSEEYRNYFKGAKAHGHWVTLDNGAGDHDLITEDVLMWCAQDLMPNEIIPLDYLFDMKKTLFALQSFLERMIEEQLIDKIEIFAVPQGNTAEEWEVCYRTMLINPYVKTLGMSKLGIPHAFLGEAKDDQGIMEARHLAVDRLMKMNYIEKPLHFLGMGNPLEMQKYIALNNPLFRSTDSCNSILSGMLGYSWEEGNFTRNKTPKNYFDLEMTEDQITLAKSNIQYLRNLLK